MLETLREIRDAARATNDRLDLTVDRLERLEKRQHEGEVRIATEIVAVCGAVNDLSELIRADRDVRAKVVDHEARIRALEQRTG